MGGFFSARCAVEDLITEARELGVIASAQGQSLAVRCAMMAIHVETMTSDSFLPTAVRSYCHHHESRSPKPFGFTRTTTRTDNKNQEQWKEMADKFNKKFCAPSPFSAGDSNQRCKRYLSISTQR